MLGAPLPSAGIAAAHPSQSRARSHQNRSGLTRICKLVGIPWAQGSEAWIDSRRTTPGEEYAPQDIEITGDRSGDTCLNKRSGYPVKTPGGVIAVTGNETSAVAGGTSSRIERGVAMPGRDAASAFDGTATLSAGQ